VKVKNKPEFSNKARKSQQIGGMDLTMEYIITLAVEAGHIYCKWQ